MRRRTARGAGSAVDSASPFAGRVARLRVYVGLAAAELQHLSPTIAVPASRTVARKVVPAGPNGPPGDSPEHSFDSPLTAVEAANSINERLYVGPLIRAYSDSPFEDPIQPVPTPAHLRSTLATLTAPPEELREMAVFHKALADPTRLRILQRLSEGPATVSELIDHVDLSQPLVSWHLRRLKAAGVIETRRSGREVISTLSRDVLDRFREQERQLLGLAG